MSGNDGRDGSTTSAYRKLILITRYSQEGHIVSNTVWTDLLGRNRRDCFASLRGVISDQTVNTKAGHGLVRATKKDHLISTTTGH